MHKTFGDAYNHLPASGQIALCTAFTEGNVSNTRLQSILDIHPADIGKLLAELTESGFLKRNSKGRWTTYTVNTEPGPTLFDGLDSERQTPGKDPSTTQDATQDATQDTTQVAARIQRLLSILGEETISAQDLMARFALKNRRNFGKNYLEPALKAGVIEMTIPDKPNHKFQKYRKRKS